MLNLKNNGIYLVTQRQFVDDIGEEGGRYVLCFAGCRWCLVLITSVFHYKSLRIFFCCRLYIINSTFLMKINEKTLFTYIVLYNA